jgi:hypothetical protein
LKILEKEEKCPAESKQEIINPTSIYIVPIPKILPPLNE